MSNTRKTVKFPVLLSAQSCAHGSVHPWRCLCFEFTQITRTTPLRWMILHLSQIFLTDALTFMKTQPSAVSYQPSAKPFGRENDEIICTCTQSVRDSDRKAKARQPPCRPAECG